MIHFEIPKNQSSIIKVIGVGGGGGNAVNYMYNLNIQGVDFIVCNTDSQALTQSPIPNKIQLGPHLTQGLGAGANPEVGKLAGEESIEDITKILKVNTRMAFITAGMGGGTGTGAAPIIAKVCKDLGILTVGIVTTPFTYEGRRRLEQAKSGIATMQEYVDTILIISNDKMRQQYGNLPFTQAFAKADNVLATAAKCITDLITVDGKVNLDFNDVQTVMKCGGPAILGSAQAAGEDRAQVAVTEALNSPLLNDSEIEGAKWILLNVTSALGNFEHTLDELDTIQGYVQQQAGHTCDIILGMGHDPNLEDRISVTIIATGFHHKELPTVDNIANKTPEKVIYELGKATAATTTSAAQVVPTVAENSEGPLAPTLAQVNTPEPLVVKPVEPVSQQKNIEEQLVSFTIEQPTPKDEVPLIVVETPKEEPVAIKPQPVDAITSFDLIIKENVPTPQVEPVKIGERILTQEEIEERNQFEAQKRAFEERAERLRKMSFNVSGTDNADEIENVPAYERKNTKLQDEPKASEKYYSGYSVNDSKTNNLSSLNNFLDGNKPD